jgi:RNA-directed DNA polymerase
MAKVVGRLERWGTETQGTHWREGEAGHNVLLDGKMSDTKRSELILTQLQQIAEQAMAHPDRVFTTLIHRMDVDFLREAYHRLRKDGAAGLSGVTVKDYGRELEANLIDLHERLKSQRYVAPPIKRVWIDKEGGKKRPIGLLEIEDKIVQKAVSMLMGAVYEQDFQPFSYGFREGCNAHQALGEIREQCMKHGIRWIVDADISGFFDNIDWGWLRTFIQQRINDGGLLRLIGKWLNAGVMEGDQITYSDKGTPQGGTISPCLANVFLHHVLDEWFVREVKPLMRGHCFIVRFADDCVPRVLVAA